MLKRFCGAILGAVTCFAAQSASADLIEVTLSGNIQMSNMTAFPVGQDLLATFRYESSETPDNISNRQAFYTSPIRYVHLKSGAYDSSASGVFGWGTVMDNDVNPFDGFSLFVARQAGSYTFVPGGTVNLDGVNSNSLFQAFEGLRINLFGVSNDIFNSYDLPETVDFASFDSDRDILVAFSNGSFGIDSSATAVTFTNLSIPEPSALSGLALAGLLLRRRNA